MNIHPAALHSSLGRTVRIGREIGKGGEGAVYEVQGHQDLAIKLYWPNKAAERRDKINAMVAAAWFRSSSIVAFPIEVLYSPTGSFAGFMMKRVGGHKPIHLLYSPSSRKLEFTGISFPFLISAATNFARAIASVHATKCVIGDVNHSGFLVSQKATISLIDSDLFQVTFSGKRFLCQVATPEYTPPELHGSRFDRTTRTNNHDNFGLAILVFQLLFMGRHPYSGRFLGRGDMPLERAIAEYRFAYSADKRLTMMEPPPNVPLLSDFPDYISTGFERAFGRDGVRERPNATAWISWLENLQTQLQQCGTNSAHLHVKTKPCPWCRMEQGNPGFIAFSSGHPLHILPLNVDTSQIAALINSIQDPGGIFDINSIITGQSAAAAPRPPFTNIATPNTQYGLGFGTSVVGLILLSISPLALIGLALCGAGAAVSFFPNQSVIKLTNDKRQAEATWRAACDAWTRQIGNRRYLECKSRAEALLREVNGLPAEERRAIQQLAQKKRDVQLQRFLERFQIKSAKIRKVGSGRKSVLASFGIETAADIERNRIASIQGFGPVLISQLLAWRSSVEGRFVYNAREPLSPADVAVVKATIATKKVRLETSLRSSVEELQEAANFASDQRRSLAVAANTAFAKLKQAEADERSIHPHFVRVARIVSVISLVLAIVNFGSLSNPPPQSQPEHHTAPSVSAWQSLTPKKGPSPNNQTFSTPNYTTPSSDISSPVHDPQTATATTVESDKSTAVEPVPPPGTTVESEPPNQAELTPPANTPAPPSPPAVEIQPHPLSPSPAELPQLADTQPKLSINRPADVLKIEQRLVELGYLAIPPSDRLNSKSSCALRDFRAANDIVGETIWDLSTVRLT